MKNDILNVLNYFNYFKYPPHIDEISMFLARKTTERGLLSGLNHLEKSKLIVKKNDRYALGGHSNIFNIWAGRRVISLNRIKKINWFIKILSGVSRIRLIGFTGGLSMLNSDKNDDIDMFVVCTTGRIWTVRLISIMLSSFFGLRRGFKSKKFKDKLCFNLFFDETTLSIPKFKKNKYIAHEIVQMRPVMIKNDTYHRFLKRNAWINLYFPNLNIDKYSRSNTSFLVYPASQSKYEQNLIGNIFENISKKIQMVLINKHRSNEIISDSQLWFFPQDFQNKIKKYI